MAQAPSSQAPKGIVKQVSRGKDRHRAIKENSVKTKWCKTVINGLHQVLSGDCVVIRGQPKGGPPPERTLALTNITAPKLGRRANPNMEGSTETKDEVSSEIVD